VLDEGRAIDIGCHGEFLDRCPLYRRLRFQQNHHIEAAEAGHAEARHSLGSST
jgi:hypothetical protein